MQLAGGSVDGAELRASSPVHKNFTRLSNMPLVHTQRGLSALEPISFSAAQLKTLVERGSRDCSRSALIQTCEFILDWDPDMALLDTHGRDPIAMNEWLERATQSYTDLGGRAKELQLPPNWDKHGFYAVEVVCGTICLVNRYTKECVAIPSKYFQHT